MTLAEEIEVEIGKVRYAAHKLKNIHDRVQGPGTASAFTQVYLRTAIKALELSVGNLIDALSWANGDPTDEEDFR